jgi:uncharacterized protein YhdP
VPQLLALDRLAFILQAEREGDGWRGAVTKLDISNADAQWRSERITAQWSRNADGGLSARAEADHVALDALWPWLAFLPESERLAQIRALAAGGEVNDVAVEFERESQEAPPEYSLKAQLNALRIAPVGRNAGIAGLTAEIAGTHEGGQLKLDSRDTQFVLPRLFRDPLIARTATGVVHWRREAQAWQ